MFNIIFPFLICLFFISFVWQELSQWCTATPSDLLFYFSLPLGLHRKSPPPPSSPLFYYFWIILGLFSWSTSRVQVTILSESDRWPTGTQEALSLRFASPTYHKNPFWLYDVYGKIGKPNLFHSSIGCVVHKVHILFFVFSYFFLLFYLFFLYILIISFFFLL